MATLTKLQNKKIRFFYKFLFLFVKYSFLFFVVFCIGFIFALKTTNPNIYKPVIEEYLKEILKM